MRDYVREHPLFSLCGLNCGLCPRFHTAGNSRCPGCGGADFSAKHPTCPIITCSRRHGEVEFCFECASYPCNRYRAPPETDSFITYRNVIANCEKARTEGPAAYLADLGKKVGMLRTFLALYDDGRKKSFYCLAVNLLSTRDVREISEEMARATRGRDMTKKDAASRLESLLKERATQKGIPLVLRKGEGT